MTHSKNSTKESLTSRGSSLSSPLIVRLEKLKTECLGQYLIQLMRHTKKSKTSQMPKEDGLKRKTLISIST